MNRSEKTGQWYRNDSAGNQTEITAAEAQAIRDTYPNIDFDWTPLKYYGKDYTPPNYSDPYANHIANVLNRFEKAVDYEYALMDIDGDGVQELIAKDSPQERDHQTYYYMSVYTIQDGEVKKLPTAFPIYSKEEFLKPRTNTHRGTSTVHFMNSAGTLRMDRNPSKRSCMSPTDIGHVRKMEKMVGQCRKKKRCLSSMPIRPNELNWP